MLAIKLQEATYDVVGYNMFQVGDLTDNYQLWIIRPGEKGMMVKTGTRAEIQELKEALDYAIDSGEKLFEIR